MGQREGEVVEVLQVRAELLQEEEEEGEEQWLVVEVELTGQVEVVEVENSGPGTQPDLQHH